jgi:hypothetical protein
MKAALTSVVASSVLIMILMGVRGAQQTRDQGELLSEAQKQHRILAPVMDKKLRYTHRLITSLAIEDFAQMALDARELKLI